MSLFLSGEIELSMGNFTNAISFLLSSQSTYKLLKQIPSSGGGDKRAELHTLSLLASALCATGETGEGMQLFREVILQESQHVGGTHHNLIPKYVNGGICAYESNLYEESLQLLKKAKDTILSNPHINNHKSERIVDEYIEYCLSMLKRKKIEF